MTIEIKELDHKIEEERKRVAADSALVRLAQKRQDKFRHKHIVHRHDLIKDEGAHKPKKVELDHQRLHRDASKISYWTRREIDAIELNRDAKAALKRLINQKHVLQVPKSQEVLEHELQYKGTHEGGALQQQWAHDLGYSASLPWCSIFQGYFIKHVLGIPLPPNPAYSGSWISWKHGTRISAHQARPGDLLIFDWGDGGMTDHVGMYMGGGQYISGNHNDEVGVAPVPWSNIVAVIRIQA